MDRIDLASGSWPTKRGTAPEPPTRRHRSEDSASDTDSVFSHQERRDVAHCHGGSEYDADRPLPPLPKEPMKLVSGRGNVRVDVRWNAGPGTRLAASPVVNENLQRELRQKGECFFFIF